MVTKSRFQQACDAIVAVAKETGFPNVADLQSTLAVKDAANQFAALQASLRTVLEHAGKAVLVAVTPLFQEQFKASVSSNQQHVQVRDLANRILDVLTQQFPPKSDPIPSKGTGSNKAVGTGAGTGTESDPKKVADEPKPTNGGKRPSFSERQWNHIVYAPQLRHRLRDGNKRPKCLALGVDFMDDAKYPHNMDAAEEKSEGDLAAAFADLEKMCMQFFNAPSLADALRLNESIQDTRREGFIPAVMARIPDPMIDPARKLLETENPKDRMQLMMMENDFTAVVVNTMLDAYATVIREQTRPAGTAAPLKDPPTGTGPSSPEPAPAGTGGHEPRLPLRVPRNPQDPLPTRNLNVNANQPQGGGGANGGQPAAQPAPDLRPQEFDKLRRDVETAKKAADDQKKLADDAKKALEDHKKAAAEELKKAEDRLKAEAETAKKDALEAKNQLTLAQRQAAALRQASGSQKGTSGLVSFGWGAVVFVLLVVAAVLVRKGVDYIRTPSTQAQQTVATQAKQEELVPIPTWDSLGVSAPQAESRK